MGRSDEALFVRAKAEHIWLAARALEMGDRSAHNWFNLGMLFTGGGHPEPALECFERAVAMEPGNAEYQFHRAWYLAIQGDLDRSLQAFERVFELDPDEPRYYTKLGLLLGSEGHLEDAMSAFDRADALDTGDDSSLQRALIYVRWELYGQALPILASLTLSSPNSRAVHRELGWCLHHVGRYDEALSSYDHAARLGAYGQPIEPWSLNQLWKFTGFDPFIRQKRRSTKRHCDQSSGIPEQ